MLNESSRKQVELGKGKELFSTDESIDNTDVEEAQRDLTTGVFCLITTDGFDFGSNLDSRAGGSLEQLESNYGKTSDRVEDRYGEPQLKTGVDEPEKFYSVHDGDIRHSNVWMVERDSAYLFF